MGRPETPIPDDRPAKELAERLRQLRHAAGSPPYDVMAKPLHVEKHTLSQTANGKFVGWFSVDRYVQALRAHGGVVTDADLAELKRLWQEAERRHKMLRAEEKTNRKAAVQPQPSVKFPVLLTRGLLSSTPYLNLYDKYGQDESWPRDPFTPPRVVTVSAFVAALNDLAQAQRVEIRSLRETASSAPAWEVLTSRRLPTADLVRQIVVEICGGQESDGASWEMAWKKVESASSFALTRLPSSQQESFNATTTPTTVEPTTWTPVAMPEVAAEPDIAPSGSRSRSGLVDRLLTRIGLWRPVRRSTHVLTADERQRQHIELTPQFNITCGDSDDVRARLRLKFVGPTSLDRLDEVRVTIRDDTDNRPLVTADGPTAEQIAWQVWGPYRFVPGVDGADLSGRTVAPVRLLRGDRAVFALERALPPSWEAANSEDWRRPYVGTPILLNIECRRDGHEPWTIPVKAHVEGEWKPHALF